MRLFRFILLLSLCFSSSIYADPDNIHPSKVIKKGLRFLTSVQQEYGEFPTIFYPNQPSPNDQLYANYDSNIFTSAMIADAIHEIPHSWVKAINQNVSQYLLRQLNNEQGLWSYFTTHNQAPLYPNTVYDLDDTAFASMVLSQNGHQYPNNHQAIKATKADNGAYYTWFGREAEDNDIDCGVNANVLSYQQDNDPGACQYLNNEVASGRNCAIYYSQLDAYYLISRAYHSGVSCLSPSVDGIKRFAVNKIDSDGSVDGNAFETAIAVNALLDVGYRGYEVRRAVNYLLSQQSKITGAWPSAPFWLWASSDDNGQPFLLGRSGSRAMTTAIALKAIYRWFNE